MIGKLAKWRAGRRLKKQTDIQCKAAESFLLGMICFILVCLFLIVGMDTYAILMAVFATAFVIDQRYWDLRGALK